jgi:hypothetical protein
MTIKPLQTLPLRVVKTRKYDIFSIPQNPTQSLVAVAFEPFFAANERLRWV